MHTTRGSYGHALSSLVLSIKLHPVCSLGVRAVESVSLAQCSRVDRSDARSARDNLALLLGRRRGRRTMRLREWAMCKLVIVISSWTTSRSFGMISLAESARRAGGAGSAVTRECSRIHPAARPTIDSPRPTLAQAPRSPLFSFHPTAIVSLGIDLSDRESSYRSSSPVSLRAEADLASAISFGSRQAASHTPRHSAPLPFPLPPPILATNEGCPPRSPPHPATRPNRPSPRTRTQQTQARSRRARKLTLTPSTATSTTRSIGSFPRASPFSLLSPPRRLGFSGARAHPAQSSRPTDLTFFPPSPKPPKTLFPPPFLLRRASHTTDQRPARSARPLQARETRLGCLRRTRRRRRMRSRGIWMLRTRRGRRGRRNMGGRKRGIGRLGGRRGIRRTRWLVQSGKGARLRRRLWRLFLPPEGGIRHCKTDSGCVHSIPLLTFTLLCETDGYDTYRTGRARESGTSPRSAGCSSSTRESQSPSLTPFLPFPLSTGFVRVLTLTLCCVLFRHDRTFSSSAPSGMIPQMMRAFGMSSEVATLVISVRRRRSPLSSLSFSPRPSDLRLKHSCSPPLQSLSFPFPASDPSLSLPLENKLFVAGYVVGPLFWGPMSETYGRRNLILISFTIYVLLQIGSALAPNTAAVLVFRFLGGVAASCPLVVTGGLLGDMFPPAVRGVSTAVSELLFCPRSCGWKGNLLMEALFWTGQMAISIFVVAPFAGPSLGPIVAGASGRPPLFSSPCRSISPSDARRLLYFSLLSQVSWPMRGSSGTSSSGCSSRSVVSASSCRSSLCRQLISPPPPHTSVSTRAIVPDPFSLFIRRSSHRSETYAPVLLVRKAKRLRKEHPDQPWFAPRTFPSLSHPIRCRLHIHAPPCCLTADSPSIISCFSSVSSGEEEDGFEGARERRLRSPVQDAGPGADAARHHNL